MTSNCKKKPAGASMVPNSIKGSNTHQKTKRQTYTPHNSFGTIQVLHGPGSLGSFDL